MDRFSDHEEIEWNSYAFQRGVDARKAGLPIDSAPGFMRGFDLQSFRAGWNDEDATISIAKLEAEQKEQEG